ncbi:heme-binding protein 2-like [Littorina saxatilis]|uniref:heme-binding protein 2-like n=1 Tax=Littorina saxatilis TaxID=31220 RepID=UPI0038B65962
MTLHGGALCVLAAVMLAAVSSASVVRMENLTPSERVWQSRARDAEAGNGTNSEPGLTVGDPPQCRKHACPPTRVLADRGSYKEVYFPVAPYAKSRVEGKSLVPAVLDLYKRLRGYITGDNKKKQELPMTLPVILRMDLGDGGMFNPKNFTMFFYVDPSVKSPPAPNNDDIDVLDVNSYTLYIRTFSGYPVTYGDWMKELLQLAADVEADGEPYSKDYYYFASYDPPTQLTGRINEVQLLKPHKFSSGP